MYNIDYKSYEVEKKNTYHSFSTFLHSNADWSVKYARLITSFPQLIAPGIESADKSDTNHRISNRFHNFHKHTKINSYTKIE